jgi:hypothetical protein
MGPYFGKLGRNTPMRLSVPAPAGADHYLQMDGTPNTGVSTPDAAPLDVTDLDIRFDADLDWYSAKNQLVVAKWNATTNQRSFMVRLVNGNIQLLVSPDGAGSPWAGLALPQGLTGRRVLRVTLDADNGAGKRVTRFYTGETMTGPWTEFDYGPITSTPAVTPFNSTSPLVVGPTSTNNHVPFTGRMYALELRSGIGGTVVANPSFKSLPAGTTSFTDAAGRPWTVAPGVEIRDRADRFFGEVSVWPLEWSTDDADIWTSVTASGVMRRLGQGQKALDSTLRRRIPTGNPIAYWPFEDQQYATQAYSPIPGVRPAAVTNVDFAALDSLPSSAPLMAMRTGGTLSAIVPEAPAGAWHVEFVYNADDKAPDGPKDWQQLIAVSTTGTVRRWVVGLKQGSARLYAFDSSGTDVLFRAAEIGADVFHGWVRLRLWVLNVDSRIQYSMSFQDVGGDAGGIGGFIASSTAGRVTAVTADWAEPMDGWGFGHLSVLPVPASTLYDGSDDAYTGETAWERMRRLSSEEGVPVARIPGRLSPERVGPQGQDTLLSLLSDAADGDGGLLGEDPSRLGMVYRERSSLYTQEPVLTLSYKAPGLGPDIRPIDDDTAVRNDIQVQRSGGSAARAFLADGPLSVQAPPLGVGLYNESLTLSLADDSQPEPVANWRLHLGTYDGARYPEVSVTLHKPGADVHVPAVLGLREGDVIRLTDLPPWVSHGPVDLMVMGWTETLELYTWTVALNCAPAGPWNTAIVNHATYGKADTDGSSLAAAVSPTATTFTVTNAGLPWTSDPSDMPIPLAVNGETVSATAVTFATVKDSFTRTVASGWGSTDSGQAWSTSGGSAADFSVNGSAGLVSLGSANVSRYSLLPAAAPDVDLTVTVSTDQTAVGSSFYPSLVARYVDGSNLYMVRPEFTSSKGVILSIRRRLAGTETALASLTTGYTHAVNLRFRVRFQLTGSTLRAKLWLATAPEPAQWALETSDTSFTAAGQMGVRSILGASVTNTLPVTMSWDDFGDAVARSQTLTVVRSTNGVVKSHPAGTPIRLEHPAIASL